MRWKSSPVTCSVLLAFAAAAVLGAAHARGSAAHGAAALADRLPLHFEPSADGFVARGRGAAFGVSASGIDLAGTGVRLRLAGADPSARVEGVGRLPGKAHYLQGSDPAQWRVDVPTYSAARARNVYPGVDFVCYGPGDAGASTRLEYDLIVHPGASPEAIRLEFPGARRSGIEAGGDLVLETPAGTLRQHRPEVYQVVGGKRRAVEARYVEDGPEIRFDVAEYDRSRPLVIDPILSYSTYLGGSGNDEARAIAIDAGGNIYIAGRTASPDFPTQNALQPSPGGGTFQDAFITKLNPTGTAVLYSTYLGGARDDNALSLAVNGAGEVYVTGATTSSDFPRQNASQNDFRGGSDAWAARLNAAGNTLLYSTYLGGTGGDQGTGIAVDPLGNAVLCGTTDSGNFPTANALQAAHGGQGDVFLAKLSPTGGVEYATYLGSNTGDFGMAVAVDAAGSAYVTGVTQSAGFPVGEGGYDTTHNGKQDAFLVKLDATGSTRLYGTFFGGSEDDGVYSVAVDAAGTACVAGFTSSGNLPTAGPPVQDEPGGGQDGFAARFNAAGTELVYATYLGGSGTDFARGVAVDGEGFAYLTGSTFSADFPVAQPIRPGAGNFDAFAAKLRPDGTQFVYSTYVGGVSQDLGNAIAIDGLGSALITGSTQSGDFPLAAPLQDTPGGEGDVFVSRITEGVAPPAVPTSLRVLAASVNQVDLAWNDNSDNELAFEIERKLGNSAFLPIGAVEADETEFFDTSVTANLVYSYRVRATNEDGASAYSNTVNASTDAVPPLAPSGLAAEVLSAASIKLTWTDNSGDENGFRIERATGTGQKFTVVGTTPPNTATFTDAGLLAKTTYTYRIRATKEGCYSAPSNTDSGTTPPNPPVAPANLTTVALSESQIKLTWSDMSDTETGFKIERKPGTPAGSGSYTEVATVEADITTFTDASLPPVSPFTYRVRATNDDGDSDASNTASTTTQPIPRGKLVVSKKLGFPKAVVNGFQTRTLVVRNGSRSERLRITVNNPTAPYSILSGGGTSLLVLGGRKEIVIKFAPTAKGKFPGSLVITSSDPKRPKATVKLTGVGK